MQSHPRIPYRYKNENFFLIYAARPLLSHMAGTGKVLALPNFAGAGFNARQLRAHIFGEHSYTAKTTQ